MAIFPILTFHSLDDSGSVISMAPACFADQIRSLSDAGWRCCSVSQVLAGRAQEHQPERVVAITFDDGYRSLVEVALPVLQSHGFTATVFVTTGRCGKDNRWPGQPSQIPTLPMLDWSDLSRLHDAGWEIGAHGTHHRALTILTDADAGVEIAASRHVLMERVGAQVSVFAYPYGAHNAAIRDRVQRSFRGACGTHLDWVRSTSDDYALPRLDAYYLRRWNVATLLSTPRGRLYVGLRRLGRAIRARSTPANAAPHH